MKQDEAEFVEKIVKYLQKFFTVKTEVWSKDKKSRIDIVLKYDEDVYFGIECKKNNSKRGEEMGEYVKQAMRYSFCEFEVEQNVYKKIPILICPPLSYNYFLMNEKERILTDSEFLHHQKWHQDRHCEVNEHHSFNGYIGVWNIGELRKGKDFLFISFSNKTIWSSEVKNTYENNLFIGKKVFGLHPQNYEFLKKKLCLQ